MNYGKIIYFDSANARGLSTVLFVSGCTNQCEGCHNKETWDFNYGQPFTEEIKEKIIKSLRNPHIKNFVISGGDPLHFKNREVILDLCREIRKRQIDVKIIVYTGYTKEELITLDNVAFFAALMNYVDYLIEGRFEKSKVTKELDYRGSTNQRCLTLGEDYALKDISSEYFKNKF